MVAFGKNVFTDIWSSLKELQEEYVKLKSLIVLTRNFQIKTLEKLGYKMSKKMRRIYSVFSLHLKSFFGGRGYIQLWGESSTRVLLKQLVFCYIFYTTQERKVKA